MVLSVIGGIDMSHKYYSQKRLATKLGRKNENTKRRVDVLVDKYTKQDRADIVRDLLWLVR